MNDGSGFLQGMFITILVFILIELIGVKGMNRDDIRMYHIEQALEVCETNEGLYRIEGETLFYHEFICNNGAVFTYKRPAKTEE